MFQKEKGYWLKFSAMHNIMLYLLFMLWFFFVLYTRVAHGARTELSTPPGPYRAIKSIMRNWRNSSIFKSNLPHLGKFKLQTFYWNYPGHGKAIDSLKVTFWETGFYPHLKCLINWAPHSFNRVSNPFLPKWDIDLQSGWAATVLLDSQFWLVKKCNVFSRSTSQRASESALYIKTYCKQTV